MLWERFIVTNGENQKNHDGNKIRRFFKIPQTKYRVWLNMVFGFGLFFMVGGVFALITLFIEDTPFPFLPLIYISLGSICLFLTFGFTKSGTLLVLGTLGVFWGFISLFSVTGLTHYSQKELWPFAMIASGIGVFVSCIYKFRKIKSSYLFPSIALLGIGIVFLLFSMHVIKMSFAEFAARMFPILCIVFGGILIGIFIFQQNKPKKFPYMDDDDQLNDGDDN